MDRDKIAALTAAERKKLTANANRWLETGSEKQKAQAQQVLDDIAGAGQALAEAEVERINALTPELRIQEAFTSQPPTKTDVKVIAALIHHPGATSEELSKASGWKKGNAWHLHFGTMCFKRRAYLSPAPAAPHRGDDQSFYSGILADFDDATHGFTLKPEAATAFRALKLG